jgi:hypothetical protein
MLKAQLAKVSADRDRWMKQAAEACINAARDVIGDSGPIRPSVPIGRLTGHEWGWICSSAVWAWIATRAEQAATEGWDSERAVRSTGLTPDPWTAGAVRAILPRLAEACPDLDWSAPVEAWSKDAVTEFLMRAFGLIERALAARDDAERRVAGATNPDVASRANAAAGNSPTTIQELNDACPF